MDALPPWRTKALADLADRPLDLLVIGGGILGAGVARDAAMRGLRVALVEQLDFAEGTSSRSSRLLHGGLRYLAQGRLGLVREAGREKNILSQIAPHLALPLGFVFPTYRGTSWPKWQLSLGVRLYDLLCGVKDAPRSSTLSPMQTLHQLPLLRDAHLTGAVRYGDGLTNDARLVLDTLRSAEKYGAILINHVQMRKADRIGSRWQCTLADDAGQTLQVQTTTIINVAGPWADRIEHSALKLRLTKGVHLVIDASRLPLTDAVVLAEGKRILFAIPYGQRVVLGTTDTDYSGPPEEVRTDLADIDYILEIVNDTFPKAAIERRDLIAEWAGLRPLIANANGSPSDISRKHLITHNGDGWIDVAGGKLTTYRYIAEQAIDQVARFVGNKAPCRTALEPLLPAREVTGLSGIEPPEPTGQVIEHFCNNEWSTHLEEVMVRRGRWTSYSPEAGNIALRVADEMARILQWDDARKAAELADYRRKTASVLDSLRHNS